MVNSACVLSQRIYTGTAILVPAMLGLSIGFLTLVILSLNRGDGHSSTATMLITVTYSSATVIAAILMSSAPITLRSMIASFVFAFMAGVLIFLIVGLGQRKTRSEPEPEAAPQPPQNEEKTQKASVTRIKVQEVGSDKVRTIRPKQESKSRRPRT